MKRMRLLIVALVFASGCKPTSESIEPVTSGTAKAQQGYAADSPVAGPEESVGTKSPSLLREVRDANTKAAAGDARAAWRVVEIYEQCAQFARSRADFDTDMKARGESSPVLARQLEVVRAEVRRRCDGLTAAEVSPDAVAAARSRALGMASVPAMISSYAQKTLFDSPVDALSVRKLVDLARTSRDPEAMAALAPLMGEQTESLRFELAPMPAGSKASEAAWLFAACRSGLDCSPRSSRVLDMCVNGGINCELRDVESFYLQELLSPAEGKVARQLTNVILNGKGD